MPNRHPGMLLVPSHRRNTTRRENKQHQIKTWPPELHPQFWNECKDYDDGEQLEYVCVFAQKPETNERTGQRPGPRKLRTYLDHPPERKHGRDPKEDRERIDRHYEGSNVKNRCGI